MKFTNEQIDYIKHCGEHVELLMGGRGHSKTKQIIEQLQTEKEQLNSLVNSCQQEIRSLKSTLAEIIEYIKSQSPDAGVCGKTILQIIDKGK